MLKLKFQQHGHLVWRVDSLEKTLKLGKTEGKRRKGGRRGWNDSIASATQWTWIWTTSRRQWRIEEPGMLHSPLLLFNCSVLSDSLWPYGLQLARLPCPSPSPRVCIRWPNYRSFSFSISLSNAYSGLIAFRIDWFDLLAVQAILQESNTTVWKHQFFGTQPSLWSNSHIRTWLLEKP